MNNEISSYIINLEKRKDRKEHILKEFKGKSEFNVQIVKATEHARGSIGLWKTMSHIVENLMDKESDYFILVEDDHQFTEFYTYEFLYHNIKQAQQLKADILLGGVSWFNVAIPISKNLFWIDRFNGTQFVIVYKSFYKKFLSEINNYTDAPDTKLSQMTNKKFVICAG